MKNILSFVKRNVISRLDKFRDNHLSEVTNIPKPVPDCYQCGLPEPIYKNFNDGSDLSEKLYGSFLAPAWSEELLKFIILYFVVLRRDEFNEPMDGIVYGVTVSLGFATFENYDYGYLILKQ